MIYISIFLFLSSLVIYKKKLIQSFFKEEDDDGSIKANTYVLYNGHPHYLYMIADGYGYIRTLKNSIIVNDTTIILDLCRRVEMSLLKKSEVK